MQSKCRLSAELVQIECGSISLSAVPACVKEWSAFVQGMALQAGRAGWLGRMTGTGGMVARASKVERSGRKGLKSRRQPRAVCRGDHPPNPPPAVDSLRARGEIRVEAALDMRSI